MRADGDDLDDPAARWLRRLGSVVQGLVLGSLLFWALVNLISAEIGARIFRYQGF